MKEKLTDGILLLLAVVSFFLSIHSNGRAETIMDGGALYSSHCSRCHGKLLPRFQVSTARIVNAISTVSAMRSLAGLSTSEIQAIAMASSAIASSQAPLPDGYGTRRGSPREFSSAGRSGQPPASCQKGT